ncbi:radical SAM protein [Thermodesulfovibrio hydrogeniphilus]
MKKPFLDAEILKKHPCFSKEAHKKYGRVHLPVAPNCNISCNYCDRRYDCVNESRPGVSSRILTPYEALERLSIIMDRERISVVGVAGPGDALANDSTFEFFKLVRKEFPGINLCLSTNGLLLPEKIELLQELNIQTITVTINAVHKSVAEKIYSWINHKGKLLRGKEAIEMLIENQWTGLKMLTEKGFYVKINSVLIPGINEEEIECIAKKANELKVTVMNIIPLIPNGRFKNIVRPSHALVEKVRSNAERFIPQIRHCKQCRADALGRLEEEKDIELELLNTALAFDYCDSV